MKTGLITFLQDLDQNPRQRMAFAAHAEPVMAEAGLSEASRVALRSRDPDKIYSAAGLDPVKPPKIIVVPQSFA